MFVNMFHTCFLLCVTEVLYIFYVSTRYVKVGKTSWTYSISSYPIGQIGTNSSPEKLHEQKNFQEECLFEIIFDFFYNSFHSV